MKAFIWLSIFGLGAAWSSVPETKQAVPVVIRDAKQPQTVFNRPALIVLASVIDKCLSEKRDMDGMSLRPPRIYRTVNAEFFTALRVNERLAGQPDLSGRRFLLRMDDTSVDLAFGKMYILMIDLSPQDRPGLPSLPALPPAYVPAMKDVGFEDDGKRVHVLRRGGELSAYDGKPSEEVRRAIERGR